MQRPHSQKAMVVALGWGLPPYVGPVSYKEEHGSAHGLWQLSSAVCHPRVLMREPWTLHRTKGPHILVAPLPLCPYSLWQQHRVPSPYLKAASDPRAFVLCVPLSCTPPLVICSGFPIESWNVSLFPACASSLLVFYVYECLSACMCVHHVHAWGPWRSEKGVVSLDLELRWVVMSHHVGAWTEPGPLQGQPVHFLTAEPSPQPLHSFLIYVFFCLICLLLVLFCCLLGFTSMNSDFLTQLSLCQLGVDSRNPMEPLCKDTQDFYATCAYPPILSQLLMTFNA